MMTIKEFARLCNCSTQTLRYYDRIGLLKPIKVDQWSRYRYYIEPQALDFIKTKNLQAADFSIQEIHSLNENNLHDTIHLKNQASEETSDFSPEQYETIWECHGWNHVHEFIDSIPLMEEELVYCFFFLLNENRYSDGIEFPFFMLGAMLPKVSNQSVSLGCSVEKSTDGLNHFALKARK